MVKFQNTLHYSSLVLVFFMVCSRSLNIIFIFVLIHFIELFVVCNDMLNFSLIREAKKLCLLSKKYLFNSIQLCKVLYFLLIITSSMPPTLPHSRLFNCMLHWYRYFSGVRAQIKDGPYVVIWTACKRMHNQYETSCEFRLHPRECLYVSGSQKYPQHYNYTSCQTTHTLHSIQIIFP